MNRNKCKKCVYYGGKRKGKVICLNDKCAFGTNRERSKNGS